jgi:hypothetical protein
MIAMRTPPKGFVTMLSIMDDKLRVRWGPVIGAWVIDRMAHIPVSEKMLLEKRYNRLRRWANKVSPIAKEVETYMNIAEEWLSMKDGRRVIFTTPVLNDKVFNALCASDMQRYGGYSRFADELEAQERQEERARHWRQAHVREELNRESFDQINFLERKRTTQLQHGVTDLKTLLK